MSLTNQQSKDIKNALKSSLRHKFANHNPEPASMPFHTKLLGKDRLALYQFIHSLNTNFGTTIFEPVAIKLAEGRFVKAEKQYIAGNKISEKAQYIIQKIIDDLSAANSSPNKIDELKKIREVCNIGIIRSFKTTRVDIYLKEKNGTQYFIDLKTAKPNSGEFKGFKRTLLEWAATVLCEDPKAKVNTLIAIPYNPYEPKPYNRWTMRGMIDLENELKVAEEFWDFLGGKGTYKDLLTCFEQVGIEMREEIDRYFSRFR